MPRYSLRSCNEQEALRIKKEIAEKVVEILIFASGFTKVDVVRHE